MLLPFHAFANDPSRPHAVHLALTVIENEIIVVVFGASRRARAGLNALRARQPIEVAVLGGCSPFSRSFLRLAWHLGIRYGFSRRRLPH